MVKVERVWECEGGYSAEVIYNLEGEHRCGYVGLDANHFLYEINYVGDEEVRLFHNFDIHGGVTFSNFRSTDKKLWWIGFDCGHSDDFSRFNKKGKVRTLQYCVDECEKLSAQIKKLEKSSVEYYLRYKKGEKILEVDHNRMIMLAMDGDIYAKRYFEITKKGLEC